jgi:quinol-cytochrome oxidoreductase complex cytochrome b subunit
MEFDLKKKITKSPVWKSAFRHDYKDTTRNRYLQVLSNVWLHLHPTKVARHAVEVRYTWGMGGISFFLFLVLTVTGVILMFYYRPTDQYAYYDMKYLMNDVPFGAFIRNMHRWGAHAMVITVWLHMLRVFMTGWDQLAIWAVTVGTNMARATPLLGHEGPLGPQLGMKPDNDVRFMLLGGTQVGPAALLRFYVLHCVFLPVAAGVLMIVHFWRVRKDGGISGPTGKL